jgi:hypothetical protein
LAGGARIPSNASRPCRSRIDTSYLIPLLLGRDPFRAEAGSVAGVFDQISSLLGSEEGGPLSVSLITIGEAFQEISTNPARFVPLDPNDLPSQRLNNLVARNRLSVCWAGHRGQLGGLGFLELATRVRSAAPDVGLADILIVTCALACPTTTRLYTIDRKLITNAALRALCRHHRSGWEITEAP